METFEKTRVYNLEEVSLEVLFDTMIKRDCLIQVGKGYERGCDKITLHVFESDRVYYFCIYDGVNDNYMASYKTKKGALNRIKKHIKNGDISNVARLL